MKKLMSTLVLFVMITLLATSMVTATSSSSLVNDLYALGAKYGLTSADKVKLERYFADNPVTDSQAEQIYAKAQEAAAIAQETGATKVEDLTAEQKSKIQAKANEAAAIAGVTLTFKGGAVEVYKDGKKIETISFGNGKLAYTGNNNTVLVVSSIAVVALATGVVLRKKFANA